MKKLIVLAIILVFGCQKEDLSNLPNPEPALSISIPNEVTDYLDNYYTNSYSFGVEITTGDESNSYEVVEVILNGDTRARGYVALNETTSEFLYFVDVDRNNFVLTTVKIETEETLTFQDIDEIEEYNLTNEYDFIQAIENMNNGYEPGDPGYSKKNGRKFWGKGDSPLYYLGPCLGGSRTAVYQNYAFWIKNGTVEINEPC